MDTVVVVVACKEDGRERVSLLLNKVTYCKREREQIFIKKKHSCEKKKRHYQVK